MSPQFKKALLIVLAIIAAIALTVAVVYFVRKPATPIATTPPVTRIASPSPLESPIAAPIFVVDQLAACTNTFTVACTVTHRECNTTTKACVIVPGAGADTCTTDAQCATTTVTHHECNKTTKACVVVPGAGADTCTTDANCADAPAAALKCVAKRMYTDDSRNRSGFYYLEKEITDTTTLQNGQTIVYNVTTKNTGGNSAPDTTITDKLADSLTYVDGDSGCTYDATTRTVTCTVGTLSPNSEAQRSFRVKVSVTGTTSVANTAEVSSTNGQRDTCSVKIDAAGKVVTVATPTPTELPVAGVFEVTVGTVGVGFILLVLGALGLLLI